MMRGKPDKGPDAGFLARWSRRKQQAREGADEPEAVREEPAAEPAADAAEVDEDTLSDAELLAKYELPDPDSLTATDDVAAFMRQGVPSRLRRLALRRVWRLDPVLANLDGLNDYDEDYTVATTVVGGLKTVYQVGKGAAAHLQEAKDKAAATEAPEAAPVPADETPEEAAHENVKDLPDERELPAAPEERAADPPEAVDEEVPLRRRHMVFSRPDGDDPV